MKIFGWEVGTVSSVSTLALVEFLARAHPYLHDPDVFMRLQT
jgi:hypothetical protein